MNWLVVTKTIEDELQLETAKREINNCCEVESLQDLCNSITAQNWYYQKILKQAVEYIAQLEIEDMS